jgi:hypothetical protein
LREGENESERVREGERERLRGGERGCETRHSRAEDWKKRSRQKKGFLYVTTVVFCMLGDYA